MISKKHIVFLVLSSLLVAFSFQGARGLFESTEGRYAEAAREMLHSQNWLIPQLNYRPHLTKPPMTYWWMGLGMKLLGQNEWGLRLYGACAFVILIFTIFEIARALWDVRTAYLSGLIATSSPFLMASAYVISTDILLALWMTLSMLCYCKAIFGQNSYQRIWINLFWFFLGLSFFTKGTPALLNLVVVLVFHIYLRLTNRTGDTLLSLEGISIFLIIALWWYLYLYIQNPSVLNYFIKDEVVNRIFSKKFDRNPDWYYPLAVYVPLMASVFIPFGVMIVPSLTTMFSSTFFSKELFWSWKWLTEHPKRVFLLLWVTVPFIAFSLSLSRLPLYILPCFIPCILILARTIILFAQHPILPRSIHISLITVIILIGAKAYMAYSPNKKNSKQIYQSLPSAPAASFYLFDNPKFFGLQFYLKGNLKRVGLSANDVYDMTFEQFVQNISQSLDRHPVFLIVEDEKISYVTTQLDALRISYAINPARHKYFYINFFEKGSNAKDI